MFDIKFFSERLRTVRTKKGLSQADLAKAIGVSAATISSYETANGAKIPALDKAEAIAEALGVSLDWLCGLTAPDTEEQNTIDVLKGLANAIEILKLDVNYFDGNGIYSQSMDISAKNLILMQFLMDLNKISSVLHDDEIPEYLKTGLKNAIYEKYKKYNISQLIYDVNNNSVQPISEKDKYPF